MSTTKKKQNRRRGMAIVLIGAGIVGLGAASASTLGINFGGVDVASGVSKVVDNGKQTTATVKLTYAAVPATYSATGALDLTTVDVSALQAVAGSKATIVISKGTTVAWKSTAVDASTGAASFTVPASTVDNQTNFSVAVYQDGLPVVTAP
ncbi:MAG: hypothetical protein AAGC49_03725 [Brevundimonas sp.]